MYAIKNRFGHLVRMKNGEPFVYSTQRLAELGAKHLKHSPAVRKSERPLRVTTA